MTKFQRREIKRTAKKHVKKQYFIFFLVCLAAFVMGTEFLHGSTYFSAAGSEPYMPVAIEIAKPLLQGDTESADQIVTQKMEGFRESGRTHGILSGLLNTLQSGELLLSLNSAIEQAGISNSFSSIVVIALSLLVHLAFWVFVSNCYGVFLRGIFMELRTYDKFNMNRTVSLLTGKSWPRLACGMLVQVIYQILWGLTIIGGIIKAYSYWATAYILAENPHLTPNQAITLSRKMMHGHKWECFKFEVSFFFWYFLDVITMGFAGILFVNLYTTAAYTEYYAYLRKLAKETGVAGVEVLNDRYLFEKPTEEALVAVYPDIKTLADTPLPPIYTSPYPLTRWFGITLHRHPVQGTPAMERRKILLSSRMLHGEIYPDQLCPIHRHLREDRRSVLVPTRTYSLTSVIALFFSAGFIGWLWEGSLHIIKDVGHKFPNRGVMHGPWLPIYAFGCILILLILYRLRSRPPVLFLSTLVLCGALEYATSWYLEIAHDGTKWWDYHGYFLNINGRICAEGLLVFGLAGLLVVYLMGPMLDNVFLRIKPGILTAICTILLIVFVGDAVYSHYYPNTGKGITDYGEKTACYQIKEVQMVE